MVVFRGWLSWIGPVYTGDALRRLTVWTASPESPERWQTVYVHSHLTACQPTSHLDGTADKPATTQGQRRRGVLALVQFDRSNNRRNPSSRSQATAPRLHGSRQTRLAINSVLPPMSESRIQRWAPGSV